MALVERFGEAHSSVGGARRDDRQRRRIGDERRQRVVVFELAARLREKMHGGIPSPRDAHQVALDASAAAALQGRDIDRLHVQPAAGMGYGASGKDCHIGALRARRQVSAEPVFRARIDNRGDVDAGVAQVQRAGVRAIVVGENHGASPRLDRITPDVSASGAGEHGARQVIARIRNEPLDRPARQDHRSGAHLPQPLPRNMGRRCR